MFYHSTSIFMHAMQNTSVAQAILKTSDTSCKTDRWVGTVGGWGRDMLNEVIWKFLFRGYLRQNWNEIRHDHDCSRPVIFQITC